MPFISWLGWLGLTVGSILAWARVRSVRLREKQLCERCGKRPPTTSLLDVLEKLSICEECSKELSIPQRSIGWLIPTVAGALLGASLAVVGWLLLGGSELAAALSLWAIMGTLAGGTTSLLLVRRKKP